MKRTIHSPEAGIRTKTGEAPNHDSFHKDVNPEDTAAHKAKIAKTDLRNGAKGHFASMAERVAKSPIYHLNYKIPHAEKHYPIDIESRFVSKFFPYAQGGPLYVDEPLTENQMIKAYDKQKLLKGMGLRSIVILNPDKFKDLETAYSDCLEQLGEF